MKTPRHFKYEPQIQQVFHIPIPKLSPISSHLWVKGRIFSVTKRTNSLFEQTISKQAISKQMIGHKRFRDE